MPRFREWLFGPARDVKAPDAFHKLSLVALLAWVGLGADGLSSSAYGPDESFRALGEHTGLAAFLALATALTVFIISYGYTRIIEQFPSGGGGYVVASKLLGPRAGLVSGSALLVDYVLTITISIASGAEAIFSFLPPGWIDAKLPVTFAGLALLTVLNIRGVKESVQAMVPVFAIFLITHAILLAVSIGGHLGEVGTVTHEVKSNIGRTTSALGLWATVQLFVRAYSMGGGTYTGIEAVSNGVAMMREPRVRTAKRTMFLMATSLAITAGGIMLAYLLMHARAEPGKTMNAVLLERVAGRWTLAGFHVGTGFVIVTLVSEAALLFVAAQAGFLDGPRVMANMAVDSWFPHRFAALSNRLAMRNGIVLMAVASLAALIYTRGDVSKLVVMYSINVFLTFSLSNLAMVRFWIKHRKKHPDWLRHVPAHGLALALCLTILCITVVEKFTEGGWVTLLVTAALVWLCFTIRKYYQQVSQSVGRFNRELPSPEEVESTPSEDVLADTLAFTERPDHVAEHHPPEEPDPQFPVAVLFVGSYSGLGRHAVQALLQMFPGHFHGVLFASIAVIDSESFKGPDEVADLEQRTRESLVRYERFARSVGLKSASLFCVGTEVPVEAERMATELAHRYPKALFVAGQLVFEEDTVWNRVLHNETAFIVQQRLQRSGLPMIVLPLMLQGEHPTAA
jgi:amino acid transporter